MQCVSGERRGTCSPATTPAEVRAALSPRPDRGPVLVATGGPDRCARQLNSTGAGRRLQPHASSSTSRSMSLSASSGCCSYTAFQGRRPRHPSGLRRGPGSRSGAAEGIGWALLSEEYIFDKNGNLDNPEGFLDYRMPVCSDLPMLDSVIDRSAESPLHPTAGRAWRSARCRWCRRSGPVSNASTARWAGASTACRDVSPQGAGRARLNAAGGQVSARPTEKLAPRPPESM